MLDLLQHDFVQNAFLAGTLIAILSALVGYFIVLRGQSFACEALSHIGFAGATGAALLGVSSLDRHVPLYLLGGDRHGRPGQTTAGPGYRSQHAPVFCARAGGPVLEPVHPLCVGGRGSPVRFHPQRDPPGCIYHPGVRLADDSPADLSVPPASLCLHRPGSGRSARRPGPETVRPVPAADGAQRVGGHQGGRRAAGLCAARGAGGQPRNT